ncbi:MAG: NAD(P)-dependent oxidoreductase [Trueperaceae bacterium]|nr:NAD(P)-dependent oxidoreductase [Trueperaceae bacterium]
MTNDTHVPVAFLGTGLMGEGMAHNILKAGYPLTVWNRTKTKTADLEAAGASVAATPAEAVREADVVLYCLSDDNAVEEVVFGETGVLTGARAGQVAIDTSTVHPETSRRQAEAYGERGIDFLDAPVFGSKAEAAAGELWVVVGGRSEVLEPVRPILAAMSQSIHHMGEVGAGATMKLVGNLVVSLQLQALSEAFVLAAKGGLELPDVHAVLSEIDIRSPLIDNVGQALIDRDFTTSFALSNLLKDTHLISRLGAEQGVPLAGLDAVRETVTAAVNQGHGDENASALIKAVEQQAGVQRDT